MTCEHGHLTIVIYTRRWRDWFRMRHWIVCFLCDWRQGPYKSRAIARNTEEALNAERWARVLGASD